MGEWRLTRSLPGPAAEAGLGAVRRVHHERWSWPALLIAKLVLDAAMVLLLIQSLSELDVDPSARPFAVFGWLLASWAALAYWVLGRSGRRSYAVCDGGLLIRRDGTGTTETIAIPWDAVESISPLTRRLHWLDGGKERYVTLRTVTARDALIESVESRHPVPAPPAQRLLAGTVFTAVAAILVWALTLSPFADIVMADRAYYLKDFASLCTTTGTSYPESAPHTETGPHPAALFDEEHGTDPVATSTGNGKATDAPNPDDVQLVACSRLVRRQVDMICTYDGGEASLTFYRARYRIDVYEAHTGLRVGGHTVAADDTDSCPHWLVLNQKRGHEEDLAVPSMEDYQRIIEDVAAGRPS
ncbi:hypothetical protein [Streptomyces swartbergensis]|uniref:Uncharacterized protein n=1 Tax=Streptomyces swartbergensis TaxID=487165 RepID=A0A243S0Y0_9ACTN|nr:hypothetical protein [Streptomyces swartbergensis]OUD00890.1 hypothetical protein CA983_23135 [Streptomyces swartbergensis]